MSSFQKGNATDVTSFLISSVFERKSERKSFDELSSMYIICYTTAIWIQEEVIERSPTSSVPGPYLWTFR